MSQATVGQKRIRRYFGKIREVLEMPNLIEVQKSSYDLFLKSGDGPKAADGEGIQGVFQSVFPIKDFNENAILEFVKYELEKPKYDVEECQARDMTYSAPLKVTLRLIVFDIDEDTGAKSVKDIKEQDVYMGGLLFQEKNSSSRSYAAPLTLFFQLRIKRVAQTVSEHIKCEDSQHDENSREGYHPRTRANERPTA